MSDTKVESLELSAAPAETTPSAAVPQFTHNVKTPSDRILISKVPGVDNPAKKKAVEDAILAVTKKVNGYLGDDATITIPRVMVLVSECMRLLGNVQMLTGPEKKSIIKGLIRRIIVEKGTFDTPEDKEAVLYFLEMAMGPLIDRLWEAFARVVDYGKKQLDSCSAGCMG